MAALDAIVYKYARRGKTVDVLGVNPHSAALRARLDERLPMGH